MWPSSAHVKPLFAVFLFSDESGVNFKKVSRSFQPSHGANLSWFNFKIYQRQLSYEPTKLTFRRMEMRSCFCSPLSEIMNPLFQNYSEFRGGNHHYYRFKLRMSCAEEKAWQAQQQQQRGAGLSDESIATPWTWSLWGPWRSGAPCSCPLCLVANLALVIAPRTLCNSQYLTTAVHKYS